MIDRELLVDEIERAKRMLIVRLKEMAKPDRTFEEMKESSELFRSLVGKIDTLDKTITIIETTNFLG